MKCICNSSATPHHFTQVFNFYTCDRKLCNLLFVYPATFPQNLYSDTYFNGTDSSGYRNYEQDKLGAISFLTRVLKALEANTDSLGEVPLQLLDIGAANGFFVELANDFGFHAKGIEVSKHAAKWAKELGRDVQIGNIDNQIEFRNAFHAITMIDVLEHTVNPQIALINAYNALKRNGVVAICVPDAGSLFAKMRGKRWHAIIPPEHLYYFSRVSIRYHLESVGFEIISMSNVNKSHTLNYIVTTVMNSSQFSFVSRAIARLIEKVPSRLLKHSLYVPIFDNLLIFARKQ